MSTGGLRLLIINWQDRKNPQAGGSLTDLQARWPRPREIWRAIRVAPRALWVELPADVRRARAAGRLRQVDACIRGHVDGYRDRPLPLEELGLR